MNDALLEFVGVVVDRDADGCRQALIARAIRTADNDDLAVHFDVHFDVLLVVAVARSLIHSTTTASPQGAR